MRIDQPKSSILNPQPSILNTQSSTLNLGSTLVDIFPSDLNSQRHRFKFVAISERQTVRMWAHAHLAELNHSPSCTQDKITIEVSNPEVSVVAGTWCVAMSDAGSKNKGRASSASLATSSVRRTKGAAIENRKLLLLQKQAQALQVGDMNIHSETVKHGPWFLPMRAASPTKWSELRRKLDISNPNTGQCSIAGTRARKAQL